MLPQDSRSPVRQQRWIECVNVGGHTIPPHGACEVTGTVRQENDRTVLEVQRPTADSRQQVVINGPLAIESGKYGACTNDLPAFVLGEIPVRKNCGTIKDSFLLGADKHGFLSLGIDAATKTTRVIRLGSDKDTIFLAFELMKDRTFGFYEERLPAILSASYSGDGCELPPSNPAAEAMITKWAEWKGIWPSLNAQLVWFHDTTFPFARGPMEAGDGGADAAEGATGILVYHPSVSQDDDDLAAESGEYCKKRFEVIACDQRAMMFETQAKYAFPYADDINTVGSNLDGNNPGDNGVYGDNYYIMGYPTPIGQWPFSQREHSQYWNPYPSSAEPSFMSRVTNPLRYCGAAGDHGIIAHRPPSSDDWILISTQVRNITALGEIKYEDCAIKSRKKRFRAYARMDGGEWTANAETEIQLYPRTSITDLSYKIRAADYVSSPTGSSGDVCVLVADYTHDCNAFTPSPSASGQFNTAAVQFYVKGVKEVTVGTDITFSCHYVFSPCYELECDAVTIEGTTECPP